MAIQNIDQYDRVRQLAGDLADQQILTREQDGQLAATVAGHMGAAYSDGYAAGAAQAPGRWLAIVLLAFAVALFLLVATLLERDIHLHQTLPVSPIQTATAPRFQDQVATLAPNRVASQPVIADMRNRFPTYCLDYPVITQFQGTILVYVHSDAGSTCAGAEASNHYIVGYRWIGTTWEYVGQECQDCTLPHPAPTPSGT